MADIFLGLSALGSAIKSSFRAFFKSFKFACLSFLLKLKLQLMSGAGNIFAALQSLN